MEPKKLPSDSQRKEILAFLGNIDAEKYSPYPNSNDSLAFSSSSHLLHTDEYNLPSGYSIYSADYDYMPAAYGGDYSAWYETMEWYLLLPENCKSIDFQISLSKPNSNMETNLSPEQIEEADKLLQDLLRGD